MNSVRGPGASPGVGGSSRRTTFVDSTFAARFAHPTDARRRFARDPRIATFHRV